MDAILPVPVDLAIDYVRAKLALMRGTATATGPPEILARIRRALGSGATSLSDPALARATLRVAFERIRQG